MRWRRVRRVTTRLAMIFVTFAARASAGIPPLAWVARQGSTTSPGRARRTAAKPVWAAERRCPVSSARRAVLVPGPAGRSPRRPSLSRQFRVASQERSPRPAYLSRRRTRSRRPARQPDHPNLCSRRSPGPIHCPCPGAGWSRHLRRGALRNLHALRGVPRNLRLFRGVRPSLRLPRGVRRNLHVPPRARRNLRLPRGVVQSRRPPRAAGPGRRPARQSSLPRRRSPDHKRSPPLRTCWHRCFHLPLRPVLNRHSHSWRLSRRRPRLRPGSSRRPRLRPGSSRRLRPRPGSSRRLRSCSSHHPNTRRGPSHR
jgi:hypothetical protein